MDLQQLSNLLADARRGKRESQKLLYGRFYGMAMSVCIRYAQNRQEAEEICNDGFVRAFQKIGDLENAAAFAGWMRKIMVRSAIDYHRKYHRLTQVSGGDFDLLATSLAVEPDAPDSISYAEKLQMVQSLPTACRVAFNLYAVEGHTTAEIAEMLQIAEGTVRANVAKARARLQNMILTTEQIKFN